MSRNNRYFLPTREISAIRSLRHSLRARKVQPPRLTAKDHLTLWGDGSTVASVDTGPDRPGDAVAGESASKFPEILTTALAAEMLHVHVEYLRRMVREKPHPRPPLPRRPRDPLPARRVDRLGARAAGRGPLPERGGEVASVDDRSRRQGRRRHRRQQRDRQGEPRSSSRAWARTSSSRPAIPRRPRPR